MAKKKNTKNNVKEEVKEQKAPVHQAEEHKQFFPNVPYNKTKRKKFFVLMILLMVCMGLVIGAMVALNNIMFAIMFAVILGLVFFLIPSTLKTHPVKEGVPELEVNGKELTIQGKVYSSQDIESVIATVLLAPVSKVDSENKQFIKDVASKYPEEECFGNLDIVLKPGPKVKKGEVLYLTIEDVVGAVTSLVNSGVKHYKIGFSLKKLYEEANFTITKEELKKSTLTETSEKDRLKQLL